MAQAEIGARGLKQGVRGVTGIFVLGCQGGPFRDGVGKVFLAIEGQSRLIQGPFRARIVRILGDEFFIETGGALVFAFVEEIFTEISKN